MTGVLIVGNGNQPSLSVLEYFMASSPVIIALDGAAIMLQQRQIQPDVIIGDMDGLTSEQLDVFQSQGAQIVKDSTQDTSDISKGLIWTQKQYPDKHIDVIGIDGGRLDHQLAAFSSLFECQSKAHLHIDEWLIVRVTDTPIDYRTTKGKNISLIPFGEVSGVRLLGCKYSLGNERLSSGTRGIHNETLGDRITISCQQGDLLLLMGV
jgi:thiamine pyrophosphokinase